MTKIIAVNEADRIMILVFRKIDFFFNDDPVINPISSNTIIDPISSVLRFSGKSDMKSIVKTEMCAEELLIDKYFKNPDSIKRIMLRNNSTPIDNNITTMCLTLEISTPV